MEPSAKHCTIYLVRHGETEFNVQEIIQGHTDSPLTESGKSQAKTVQEAFKNIEFSAVFASDLLRAVHTAQIISAERKLAVNTKKLLRERHFGKYDGRPAEEFRRENEHLFEKINSLPEEERRKMRFGENYESEEEVGGRTVQILREIAVTYPGQNVLVVTHGGVMRSLLIRLGYGNYNELKGKTIGNTAYAVLESDGVDFFIKETKGIKKLTF
ncbi:MAG: histidine phosphatase family protein [Candidatus Doudnabacteria bacterium]|nr:histidine phosphatase family protein [Candidatus Doudnabacteria bacterium]